MSQAVRQRRRRHQLELLVLVVLGAIGVWLAVAPAGPAPLRAVLVSPLVLLLPGLAATEATFLPGTLSGTRRLVLGIGASLALAVLVGLVLNLFPEGLTVRRWAASLEVLTFVVAGVALVRQLVWRRRGRESTQPSPGVHAGNGDTGPPEVRLRPCAISSSAALAVAAVVVVALLTTAFVVARHGVASQQRQVAFTQLWMLPTSSGPPGTVSLGVQSHEPRTEHYEVALQAAGRTVWTSPRLELATGQQWETSVSIAAGASRRGTVPTLGRAAVPPGLVDRLPPCRRSRRLAAGSPQPMTAVRAPTVGRRDVDVLVVCAGSTTGHRRNEALVTAALRDLGLAVAEARTDYRLVDLLRRGQPFIDLVEAAAMSAATRRALRDVRTRSILYPTSLSAILEPASRLRMGAIRFDALAAENRGGHRNVAQRRLERRSLALARALAPTSLLAPAAGLGTPPGTTVVPLPPPIDGRADPAGRRQPATVCYAADPHKKGLDLVVSAWAQARPPAGHQLLVTGIGQAVGRRFLRRSGVAEPPGMVWMGPVPADRFRRLTATAEVYLAASRYEDFGMAQLEALADGAMLVTTPSAGPFEALPLARKLHPGLVPASSSPGELAASLRRGGT